MSRSSDDASVGFLRPFMGSFHKVKIDTSPNDLDHLAMRWGLLGHSAGPTQSATPRQLVGDVSEWEVKHPCIGTHDA
jgi:hypothetical protein